MVYRNDISFEKSNLLDNSIIVLVAQIEISYLSVSKCIIIIKLPGRKYKVVISVKMRKFMRKFVFKTLFNPHFSMLIYRTVHSSL